MTVIEYAKRVVIMLCLAMPATVLALTVVTGAQAEDIWSVIGAAAFLTYVWGVVSAAVVSLAHTYLVLTSGSRSCGLSLCVAGVLGLGAGAITPTAFTGIPNGRGMIWGALTALVYAAVVRWLREDRPEPIIPRASKVERGDL